MVPRAVLMAAEVNATLGPPTPSDPPLEVGNILAPNYRSWQNNSAEYYTSGPSRGSGTGFNYTVRSFDGFYTLVAPDDLVYTPTYFSKWGQPHIRQSTLTGSFLYPQSDQPVPPAIDIL